MFYRKTKEHSLFLFFLFLCITVIITVEFSTKKQSDFIAPSKDIKFFTLGYQDPVSDSLWIRVIQDFDFCVNNKQDRHYENTNQVDYSGFSCDQGWVYQMLDVITELTPRNRLPYTVGAMFLSVLVNDKEGARRIFEKGLKQYPFDWVLNYRAAYHYMIEMNNDRRAADLLNTAAEHGAPKWVFSLASKLYQKEGRRSLAIMALKSYLQKLEDSPYRDKIEIRLKEILQEKTR